MRTIRPQTTHGRILFRWLKNDMPVACVRLQSLFGRRSKARYSGFFPSSLKSPQIYRNCYHCNYIINGKRKVSYNCSVAGNRVYMRVSGKLNKKNESHWNENVERLVCDVNRSNRIRNDGNSGIKDTVGKIVETSLQWWLVLMCVSVRAPNKLL